jgi:hypothetical protein
MVIHFVRRPAVQRHVWPVGVVPLGQQTQLVQEGLTPQENQQQPGEALLQPQRGFFITVVAGIIRSIVG